MKHRKLFRTAFLVLLIVSLLALSLSVAWQISEAQIGSPFNQTVIWRDVDASRLVAPAGTRIIIPNKFRTVELDTASLRALLSRAPMEFTPQARGGGRVEILLPTPDGRFERFRAEESPVMEPLLAARHPQIKTYRAQGVDDPAATARFGLTPAGFHAIVLSPSGTFYIDPYRRGEAVTHITYFKRDYPLTEAHRFECQVLSPDGFGPQPLTAESAASIAANRPNGGSLRTYRLAFAANFEYSDFHSDDMIPDKAEVLANGIIPAVNRVNGIYEREVAVHMNLVANEELLIFNTQADPYVNDNGTQMLAANQATCDALIGPLNYDIGHVASTGGGGVAFLGVVCSVQKAGGVTGLPAPTGDPYYVDYVAHEMGHQFGGNHTFNGSTGACSGSNRNAGTAYEVGSGSTIQAYAGICAPQNLQPNSDDYFHGISYDEILTHISTEATCSVNIATGNTPPTVDAGPDFNIPARTAFTVTPANSGDADGDTLSYCWEEFDLGPAGDGNTDNGSSPIFRSFNPTSSSSRTFPKLSDQLNNVSSYGEKLPTTTRTMNFRVTVRDNKLGGGGVEYDSMRVHVTATAGPFVVTIPNGGETWDVGTSRAITWNVANTDLAPINTTSVDIHLSTDGGQTFPILLASAVPNDGVQDITVPVVSTNKARVRVSANGNIFHDLSDSNFRINPPPVPPVAVNDSASTPFHTSVLVSVLANDSDPDGFPLSIVSVQSPTNSGGTAFVDDNGTPENATDDRVLYTPPPLFSGVDQFAYTISDGGMEATGMVTVTVTSFCPPVPTGSFFATFETDNGGFTVSTPANAPTSAPWTRVADPGAHSPTMSFFTDNAGVNGAQKADRLISPPQRISSTSRLVFWQRFSLEPDFDAGVLEVSTNGGASYVDITAAGGTFLVGGYNRLMPNGPLNGRMAWNGRSPGFFMSTMNRVEVELGALAGQTVIFRWNFRADNLNADEAIGWWVDDIQFTNLLVSPPCNEPPFAVSQSVATNEDTPLGVTLSAIQGDDNDPLTFTIQSGPSHGSLDGTPPNLTYTPQANYHGGDSFTFRVSDGTNTSNLATVLITVASVNDPPQASDDTAVVNENSGANQIDVLRNDTAAPDQGETLSIESVTQGSNGAVAITGEGALLTYTPFANFSGNDSFTYTVTDGNGGETTATVRVTVIPVSDLVNYALSVLNSVASASSTYTTRNYSVTGAFDGDRTGANWEQGGGWNDATRGLWPDYLDVTFGGGSKTIKEIRVYTLQNNFHSPQAPDVHTDASLYGLIDFDVQVWDGAQWVTVPNGQIRANTKAMIVIPLATPVNTTAVRVFVHLGRAYFSRIVELEAFGDPGQ